MLIPHHCCRTRHNAHQKQITSPCKSHQEILLSICGYHPWAGTLPYTLPGCGKTRRNRNLKAPKCPRELRLCCQSGASGSLCRTQGDQQVKEGTGQTSPTRGMGDDSSQGLQAPRSWEAQLFLLPPKYRKTSAGTCDVTEFVLLGIKQKDEEKGDVKLSFLFCTWWVSKTVKCFSYLEI